MEVVMEAMGVMEEIAVMEEEWGFRGGVVHGKADEAKRNS